MHNTTLACVLIRLTPHLLPLVPESPALFSSSPFKALSPQPPKFLKALLTVREENNAKKVLEARPLLGQEVTGPHLSVHMEDFILTLWIHGFPSVSASSSSSLIALYIHSCFKMSSRFLCQLHCCIYLFIYFEKTLNMPFEF